MKYQVCLNLGNENIGANVKTITANGCKFSDKERRQNQPPTIIIQQ